MFTVSYDMGRLDGTLARFLSRAKLASVVRAGAREVVNKTAEWIMRRSATRHKWAERLGVKPTGILEFTHGNGDARSGGGGHIYYRVRDNRATMYIGGVPFIQKAFRDLDIHAKNASYLTIPVHRDSARTPARQIGSKGYKSTFIRPAKKGGWLLFGAKSKNAKGTRTRSLTLLYVLKESVRVPRDPKLLPASYLMNLWASKAMRKELMTDAG